MLIDRFFGLLFLTQGFLMMYVSLEKSTAVFGFLLFFELALALLGSYCLTNADGEEKGGCRMKRVISLASFVNN